MQHTTPTSARELRAIFNSDVLPRERNGEYFKLPLPPTAAAASSGQPPGTLSQTVIYMNGHEVVAYAHQFVSADGETGASGLPDPKLVLFEGEWLSVDDSPSAPLAPIRTSQPPLADP
ncbi:hypothetical protein [Candidatus Poriferisodalis sp.]|uniref:hypothetical protein n=1 Tax=Candidatus Poriferisodalis sp. TaxID=3101277 RepID=UPI003B01D32F